MSRTPLTKKPLSLGYVETGLLNNLRDASTSQIEIVSWNAELSYVTRGNEKITKALSGITEQLISHCASLGEEVGMIQFEVDSSPVSIGKPQRDMGWHMDGVLCPAVVVADTLTTEFLINSDNPLERMAPKQLTYDTIINEYINQDIERGALEVYSPEPQELVLMTNHVHRSPFNNSSEILPRVWLRAFLFGANSDAWGDF